MPVNRCLCLKKKQGDTNLDKRDFILISENPFHPKDIPLSS